MQNNKCIIQNCNCRRLKYKNGYQLVSLTDMKSKLSFYFTGKLSLYFMVTGDVSIPFQGVPNLSMQFVRILIMSVGTS